MIIEDLGSLNLTTATFPTHRAANATTTAAAPEPREPRSPPASAAGSGVASRLQCQAVYPYEGEAVDKWCDENCNHVPAFCPESHCMCR